MEYDIKVHLPQQIENLLQAYASGDIETLTRVKDNLLDIIEEKTFQKDLKALDEEKIKHIDTIKKKAMDAVKLLSEVKTLDEIFVDVEEIRNDLVLGLNNAETEYWEGLKDYIIGYMEHLE